MADPHTDFVGLDPNDERLPNQPPVCVQRTQSAADIMHAQLSAISGVEAPDFGALDECTADPDDTQAGAALVRRLSFDSTIRMLSDEEDLEETEEAMVGEAAFGGLDEWPCEYEEKGKTSAQGAVHAAHEETFEGFDEPPSRPSMEEARLSSDRRRLSFTSLVVPDCADV